ncbi:hypothetical protein Taro_023854 [Colocasia esculenta]|uniref:RING-type E3 ubiquitin transferase n=1 Tax=Colocasia esculenta TaxID=4460 RepID=A0A843VCP5_COLES|nr:hypothetical protein [Colocasia esculenta]
MMWPRALGGGSCGCGVLCQLILANPAINLVLLEVFLAVVGHVVSGNGSGYHVGVADGSGCSSQEEDPVDRADNVDCGGLEGEGVVWPEEESAVALALPAPPPMSEDLQVAMEQVEEVFHGEEFISVENGQLFKGEGISVPTRLLVLCKFFAHGACLKGEHCEFSHDWRDPANNICTFYQKGLCSYGSRCRYDHVKTSRQASVSLSPSSCSSRASNSVQITHPSGTTSIRVSAAPPSHTSDSTSSSRPVPPIGKPVWAQEDHSSPRNENGHNPGILDPAEKPICSFAAAGNCPRGESCPHIHGDLCPTCGKHCLHPYRTDEREEHIRMCQKNSKHLEALRLSQEIECSVCLERVLSKPTPAERKFGLLSECDHPFCISCIRNWRSNSPSSGMDVNTALRACPICRKLSYFVIPSVIWYSSKEEKQEIVDGYKAKLRSIDCKYFDFGNGSCPFGTSCFYRHAYRDGRLEEVVLRHLDADDGKTVIAKDISSTERKRAMSRAAGACHQVGVAKGDLGVHVAVYAAFGAEVVPEV